ncbi:MAG: DNA polymerase domain-containing protein [Gammaproteobacteria bacterium]
MSYVAEPSPALDLIQTPGGAFRREPAILPGLLDELFPRREAAREAGDDVASNAIKILMNSFYGVLGTSACRFYNPALANSITVRERKSCSGRSGGSNLAAIACSTATRTACSSPRAMTTRAGAREQGAELARALNGELAEYIEARWRVRSRLSLKFEKLYLRLFLPRARNSVRGASKRYAGTEAGQRRERGRVRRHGGRA